MPQFDTPDSELSSGFGTPGSRSGRDREQVHGHQYSQGLASYRLQDHLSGSLSTFGSYAGISSRPQNVQDGDYSFGMSEFAFNGPNRHNLSIPNSHPAVPPFSSFNVHNQFLRQSPPLFSPAFSNSSTAHSDKESYALRPSHHSASSQAGQLAPTTTNITRSTLWWGEMEPWMDEEYAKQVCNLMGWDSVNIKIPQSATDSATGQQANNPGYCFLTFPTPAHAASVLAQINNGGKTGNPLTMPNSSKPFVLNWASSVPTPTSPLSSAYSSGVAPYPGAVQQYPKEYSIFVGDLAPETSNSDLVAVFRNPVLGLRNDREPKFIRPFLSCKSAKIMLDPVTGISRGYGFVRFTDESDQQRALIEMHGLYCLSRPMRISPATAKFKLPAGMNPLEAQFSPLTHAGADPHVVSVALPLPSSTQTKSVSAPIARAPASSPLNGNGVTNSSSGSSLGGSNSSNSLSSGSSATSVAVSGYGSLSAEDIMNLPSNVLALAQQFSNEANGAKFNGSATGQDSHLRLSEQSWKHHAQARAILGNLIGPNGEQLTSTDPYNTTVFVGGLSPLISEETLRTFFAPFGDIHYVKVPVGKHCGFVQFVRKADAERAIEKMQGFPIGGSRIRLSWGRSQYKAAQAAAQAAQAAALQSAYVPPELIPPNTLTQEQALQLLQKISQFGGPANAENHVHESMIGTAYGDGLLPGLRSQPNLPMANEREREEMAAPSARLPRIGNFSPFSPDPNASPVEYPNPYAMRSDAFVPTSKVFTPAFFSSNVHESKVNNENGPYDKLPPTSPPAASSNRFATFFDKAADPPAFSRRRAEAPISRPPSGHTSTNSGEHENAEFDMMHDFNGTLASLNLDSRPWKANDGSIRSTTMTSP